MLYSPFQNSSLCAVRRPDFFFKRFCFSIVNSLILISQKYISFGGNCNKKFLLEFARLKNARGSASYRMSHTLQSLLQNSLLCALGRPDFCFKRFCYTILNSLIFISQKYISFWGNCSKISFSYLPALKTPVDRHPIGHDQQLALSRNQEYFIFRLENYNCLLKTFYLKTLMDCNPTQ